MMDLHDKMVRSMREQIKVIVKEAYEKKQMIFTNEFCRRIGKTTTLIELAKQENIPVIVAEEAIARALRTDFNYDLIYSQRVIGSLEGSNVVENGVLVDEMVSVELVLNYHIDVLTGFKYRKEFWSKILILWRK